MRTSRLKLEAFTTSDIDLFHHINTNAFVRKYLWDDEVIPLKLSEEILAESEHKHQTEKWGLWKIIVSASNECIGYVGLWYFFDEKYPQLLYALLPEYAGKGYATEASNKVMCYTFEELQFDYIVAAMDAPNTKSIHVCEKLGMDRMDERMIEGKPTLFYRKYKNR